jgi:porphobilinogen synthase
MVGSSLPGPEKFIWPVFVRTGMNTKEPIESMPGQYRWSVDRLCDALEPVRAQGVKSILVFGIPDEADKDAAGTYASSDDSIVQSAVRVVIEHFPDMLVFTDVCLCAYTDHGHCGVVDTKGQVLNDESIARLGAIALSHAQAGAHGVAPSAMMDGQVSAIRSKLDTAGYVNTIIMSYSTKFASSMYGPFREAERSAPKKGNRMGYQASYDNSRLAIRESLLDEAEGADILMVKPSLFYLDIIAQIREKTSSLLAAYNVSGEYAMLHAAAQHGWGDLRAMVRESTAALTRAGADIIISYWANHYKEYFEDKE